MFSNSVQSLANTYLASLVYSASNIEHVFISDNGNAEKRSAPKLQTVDSVIEAAQKSVADAVNTAANKSQRFEFCRAKIRPLLGGVYFTERNGSSIKCGTEV